MLDWFLFFCMAAVLMSNFYAPRLARRSRIADLRSLTRARLPALPSLQRVDAVGLGEGAQCARRYPEWGRAGLLMTYSSGLADGYRHTVTYVAKILTGTKPGDLPSSRGASLLWWSTSKPPKRSALPFPRHCCCSPTR